MSNDNEDEKGSSVGWRRNWFIKNVIAEIPIFWCFFYTSKKLEMANRAFKSATLLSYAGIFMAFDVLSPKENDTAAIKTAKMTAAMGISIFVSTVTFNCIKSLGKEIYGRCTEEKSDSGISEKMLLP